MLDVQQKEELKHITATCCKNLDVAPKSIFSEHFCSKGCNPFDTQSMRASGETQLKPTSRELSPAYESQSLTGLH